MLYHRVKGCYDVLPESDELWKETHIWHFVEEKIRNICRLYDFIEVRPPIFEYTDVFTRSSGDESDIVSKEMYTFQDKAGRSLSLRPEITASVIRAFNESSLAQSKYDRFFYLGPCFRYDRSQKGRYRQFTQFGIEVIGQNDPLTDAEIILMLFDFYHSCGLKNLRLLINCIGDATTRKDYAEALREYFKPHFEHLSSDSQRRYEKNPLRILDSKEPGDKELSKNAPKITEFLTQPSKDRFKEVLFFLDKANISYAVEPSLVRGLDYYSDIVFEVVSSSDIGAQNTIGAGGRYDGLIENMGGNALPGIGFATGMERIIQSLISEGVTLPSKKGPTYYFIPLTQSAKTTCFELMQRARKLGNSAVLHQRNFNIKKGLQMANALSAEFAIIVGEDELKKHTVKIKHLFSRFEGEFTASDLSNPTQLLKGSHDSTNTNQSSK